MVKEGKRRGLKVVEEVFVDRGYNFDGIFVNRNLFGVFVKEFDEVIVRVIKMIKIKKVIVVNGEEIDIVVDFICVYGDNLKVIEFVDRIRKLLIVDGIEVKLLYEFIK